MTGAREPYTGPSEAELARFSAETRRIIAESRQPHSASSWPPAAHVHAAVAEELRPLVFQVAEMAEHEPDNLRLVAEYLHGLLEREPLRTSPYWAPQATVLGLFLMGLTAALERIAAMTAEERRSLRLTRQREAVAVVTATFDPVYIPPTGPAEGETLPDPTAPETTDADLLALL